MKTNRSLAAPRQPRSTWGLMLATAVIMLLLALYLGRHSLPRASAAPAPASAFVPAAASTPAAAAANGQELQQQQQDAAAATASAVGQPPLQGPVTQRPDFVSKTEWQVLQGLAQQKADPPRELTRLVNELRFNKLLELWHNPPAGQSAAQRRTLAQQLLDELPERVKQGRDARAEAERLQRELLTELEPDPQARRAREAEEADRLREHLLIEQP